MIRIKYIIQHKCDLVSISLLAGSFFIINDKVYNIPPEIAGRVTLTNAYFEVQ